jgi:ribosomal protein S18 acetylase RimI-like enzyme
MARTAVRVRAATEEDLPALLDFSDDLRDQLLPAADVGGRGRASSTATRSVLAARYLEALADPERHLVVAVGRGEEPLGMALLTVTSANALLDIPAVHMSHAVVPDRHRRRGVGKALVAACAAFAEERGVDQVVVSVHPGSRDANRFFARLGFAPLAVRRVAPVSVVRRHLAAAGELSPADHVVRQLRRPVRRPRAGAPLGRAGDSS